MSVTLHHQKIHMAHQYMDQTSEEILREAFIVAHVRSPLFKCHVDDYFFQIINFAQEKYFGRKSDYFKCQSKKAPSLVYQLA